MPHTPLHDPLAWIDRQNVTLVLLDNWLWLLALVLAIWYLRWYLITTREAAAIEGADPVAAAFRGFRAEAELQTRRVLAVVGFLVGAVVLALKVIGLTLPALVTLDPVAWGNLLTIGMALIQLGTNTLSDMFAAGLVIAGTVGVWLLRDVVFDQGES